MDQSITRRSGDSSPESLSVAVVEAVAEREAVNPLDLDIPLYDAIDPDALERLFTVDAEGRPGCAGHVTFDYGDRRVRVSSDREVRVLEPESTDVGEPGDGDA